MYSNSELHPTTLHTSIKPLIYSDTKYIVDHTRGDGRNHRKAAPQTSEQTHYGANRGLTTWPTNSTAPEVSSRIRNRNG